MSRGFIWWLFAVLCPGKQTSCGRCDICETKMISPSAIIVRAVMLGRRVIRDPRSEIGEPLDVATSFFLLFFFLNSHSLGTLQLCKMRRLWIAESRAASSSRYRYGRDTDTDSGEETCSSGVCHKAIASYISNRYNASACLLLAAKTHSSFCFRFGAWVRFKKQTTHSSK